MELRVLFEGMICPKGVYLNLKKDQFGLSEIRKRPLYGAEGAVFYDIFKKFHDYGKNVSKFHHKNAIKVQISRNLSEILMIGKSRKKTIPQVIPLLMKPWCSYIDKTLLYTCTSDAVCFLTIWKFNETFFIRRVWISVRKDWADPNFTLLWPRKDPQTMELREGWRMDGGSIKDDTKWYDIYIRGLRAGILLVGIIPQIFEKSS